MADTLRYIKVDYQSHKDALLQRIRDRWPRNWNDFAANNFGIVLVDIVAWGFATMAFLLNRIGAENFVSTMTLRESAVRLGSLVGYKLRSPIPATVACEASLSAAQSSSVTIAKGTLIRTSDNSGITFEVAKDYTIEAGYRTPRTLIARLSPLLSGSNVINSFVSFTSGSVNVDLTDSSINLSALVQAGQSINVAGSSDVYTIQSLETAPGAVSDFTRLVLDRPFAGTTDVYAAEIYDQRIQLVQGQTITEAFVAPSTSSPGFIVKLSRTPVIDNTVEVTVNGEPWTRVQATGMQGPYDEVFQVTTFVSGISAISFGDGNFGAMLPLDAAIAVSYRIGGGRAGNIDINTINTSITGLMASLSNPVPIAVTNATSYGAGGQDAETLEEARTNIPRYARTNDRAVTLSDYQTLAQQFNDPNYGSVAFARAATRHENAFFEGNIVVVYGWTTGLGGGLLNLSPQLKTALQEYLQTKALGTDLVQVQDGTTRPVPVAIRFQAQNGFTIADVREAVKSTLSGLVNSLRPGDPLIYSNLVTAVSGVYGLKTFTLATPLSDLIPSNSTELLTPPQDDFVYDIVRNGAGIPETDENDVAVSPYTAQLPIFPLQAWAFEIYAGANKLTVVPDAVPGQARLFGANLSADDAYASTVNLLTGQMTLWISGAPGDLTMKLVTASGYLSERVVNVYVGYTGDNTATARHQIRSALRSWSSGLSVGGTIYSDRISGINASKVSIADVVKSVTGVDSITRVALDTPGSNQERITAADFELIRVGNIVLNSSLD